MYVGVNVHNCKTITYIHTDVCILLEKKVYLTYFDQGLENGTSWLNARNLTVGQARTRRREKLVKSVIGEGNNQTLSSVA